jgi:hypothetical protein
VHSDEATEAIVLNDLDVEFIEQDHNESGASNGNLDVIVDEGLVNYPPTPEAMGWASRVNAPTNVGNLP